MSKVLRFCRVYCIPRASSLKYVKSILIKGANMELFNKSFTLTPKVTQTNIKIPFLLPQHFIALKISFKYGPKFSTDPAAKAQVKEAIEKYVFAGSPAKDYIVENYLPVENFITLSLSKDGNYLGGYHNKADKQDVFISPEGASLGFWPTEIAPGAWELQLNCHCIASEKLQAEVRIEGME